MHESYGLLSGLSIARQPLRSGALSSVRSNVHPKYKTKYCVKNWAAYDRALVARGDITLWITPQALEAWRPAPTDGRGAQPKFSDLAIATARTLRLVFQLPLRQAEGSIRSILRIMGLDLESPDHTTPSRRSQSLARDLRALPHQQARAANAFSRARTIFGDRMRARSEAGRQVQARIACDVLYSMTRLGRPKSVAIGA